MSIAFIAAKAESLLTEKIISKISGDAKELAGSRSYESKKPGTGLRTAPRCSLRFPNGGRSAWFEGEAKHEEKTKEKTKEQRISPLLPGLYPPPGTSPNSDYCNCGQVALTQVACTTIGAA